MAFKMKNNRLNNEEVEALRGVYTVKTSFSFPVRLIFSVFKSKIIP